MQIEKKIDLAYVIESIQTGTLKEEEVYAAKEIIDNEIMQCENILTDDETKLHSRREFVLKLKNFRKLKNRL